LKSRILALKDHLVELRRHFHMYPEIGYDLERTSSFVARYLKDLGLEVKEHVAKTGVVAVLRGAKPGKTILLRADMDALPLQDLKQVSYKSRIDGAMHACGHDGHTAMLLVAAKLLCDVKERLSGNVKFVFQPCEEKFPPGGALPMIEQGVLENPTVDAAFGIHLWTLLPAGTIGIRAGTIMAAADEFHVNITGRGGHGAQPHLCKDPIVISSHLIQMLQTLISRETDPLDSAVITVGKIESGTAFNIIPETAHLEGTVRTLSEQTQKSIQLGMRRIVEGVEKAFDVKCELDYRVGPPPVVNDLEMTKLAQSVAELVVGKENVIEVEPSMGGEDMSFFLKKVPGVFCFVGASNPEKGIDKPHHSPYFDIDEDALLIGTQMHVEIALKFLGG